jgi:hypothetical protein
LRQNGVTSSFAFTRRVFWINNVIFVHARTTVYTRLTITVTSIPTLIVPHTSEDDLQIIQGSLFFEWQLKVFEGGIAGVPQGLGATREAAFFPVGQCSRGVRTIDRNRSPSASRTVGAGEAVRLA